MSEDSPQDPSPLPTPEGERLMTLLRTVHQGLEAQGGTFLEVVGVCGAVITQCFRMALRAVPTRNQQQELIRQATLVAGWIAIGSTQDLLQFAMTHQPGTTPEPDISPAPGDEPDAVESDDTEPGGVTH